MIRKSWTRPGRFSHHGKRWHFDDIVVEPAPVQRPHPPFWLGAGSAESIRRAAREGYNLLLDQIGSTDLTIERVAIFREECAKAGRTYDPMMVGVTRGLQLLRSAEERQKALATRTQRDQEHRRAGARPRRRALYRPGESTPPSRTTRRSSARPRRSSRRLRRLEAGGVGYVLLVDPAPAVSTLTLFAQEIMPEFAKRTATFAKALPRERERVRGGATAGATAPPSASPCGASFASERMRLEVEDALRVAAEDVALGLLAEERQVVDRARQVHVPMRIVGRVEELRLGLDAS